MRTRWLLAGLVLASCGRRNFEPLRDGSVVDDALDAPGAVDASPACTVTFCDNFDRTGAVTGGWDVGTVAGSPMAMLTNGQLQIILDAVGDSRFLVKSLPAPTTFVRVAFEISYTSATPGIAEIDLVQLRWNTPAPGCTSQGFYLVRNSTGPFDLQETYAGCSANVDTALVDLANSGLHTVEMTVVLGALNAARIEVSIDHATPTTVVAAHPIPSSTLQLGLGAGAVRDVTTPWDIRYDNLTVDVQ